MQELLSKVCINFFLVETLKTLFAYLLMKCLHVDHAVKRDIYFKSFIENHYGRSKFPVARRHFYFTSKGGTIMQSG